MRQGHVQEEQKTPRILAEGDLLFTLQILDQYYIIMCRGEPVTGTAKSFEDQLTKYQWTN